MAPKMTCRENFKNAGISKSERTEERPNLGPFSRWPIRKRSKTHPIPAMAKGSRRASGLNPKRRKLMVIGQKPKGGFPED